MTKLRCGCTVSDRKAALLNWLLDHHWIMLFDLIHGTRKVLAKE